MLFMAPCSSRSPQYQQIEYNQAIHQYQRYPGRCPNGTDSIDDPRLETVRIALHAETHVTLSRSCPADSCEKTVFAQYADCVQEEDADVEEGAEASEHIS